MSIIRGGRSPKVDLPLLQPLAVGVRGGQLGLDLVVVDDPALGGVHEEHPAGLEAALAHHLGGVDVEHAHLRGQHHQAVVGHPVRAPGADRCGRAPPPTTVPSVKTTPAGPSQGSMSEAW